MQIRKLKSDDFDKFKTLMAKFLEYAHNDPLNDESMTLLFKQATHNDSNFFLFVAELENELVGQISVTFGESSYKVKPFAYVDDFFVISELRGKGIGRMLMEEIKKIAKDKQCSSVLVGVGKNESDTIKFYETNGFIDLECKLMSLPL